MAYLTNRIRTLRQERGLTLQQLAEASGTSKSQIDKLEKGDRRLTVDWMVRLAKPLGCDPRDLLDEGRGDGQGSFQRVRFAPSPTVTTPPIVTTADTLPVRGAARGGKSQQMFLTDGAIDWVPRPHYLMHVRDAYATYVVGDSMVPMYRPRQLLFINPFKPPVTGTGVVIVQPDQAVLIKAFVRSKANGIVVREYHPTPREFTIPLDQIASLHTVVGATEPQ